MDETLDEGFKLGDMNGRKSLLTPPQSPCPNQSENRFHPKITTSFGSVAGSGIFEIKKGDVESRISRSPELLALMCERESEFQRTTLYIPFSFRLL